MEQQDASFLHTKRLVYSCGLPLPFSVYEGMAESIYMIANSVAYTSVCSPGLYKVLRDFFFGIEGVDHRVIVDDILGMTGGQKQDDVRRPVWTRRFIEQLTGLNRISWRCPHTEGAFACDKPGLYWQATPLAFLHEKRLDVLNADVVNKAQGSWFMLPMGMGEKARTAVHFYLTFVKRPVYVARIPAAHVDDTFVIVPPAGVSVLPVVKGVHVERPPVPHSGGAQWSLDNESKLFQYLYG